MADAGAFTVPTLLIGAGADWVVSLDAQERFFRDLTSPRKEMEVFPLRFSFERPHTTGWLGAVFDSFHEMDRPFNQLPSLHIALRTILADMSIVKSATPAAPQWCWHGLS